MPRCPFVVIGVALTLAVAGCGDGGASGTPAARPGASSTSPDATREVPSPASTTPAGSADAREPSATGRAPAPTTGRAPAPATDRPPPRSWTATCPTRTPSPMGCRGVRGRVLAIQSYDPDGDGDLHVIAVGGDVTSPGITIFDVRASLRPKEDPVKGEYVTGAGPVFRGSLKQRQIQVDVFRVWRPRG